MNKNITRDDIAEAINLDFGLSKKDCLNLVNDIIEIIISGLENNQIVKIHNFGTFKLKRKKSRIGRNPKTKKEFMISERNVISFKPSKSVLIYINKLKQNTKLFRDEIKKIGFEIKPGNHPIIPIMLYDAKLSQDFANKLLEEGIYVIGFFYPVVPKGEARIRVQLSAGHEKEHLDKAIDAFKRIGKELGVIK